MAVLRSHGCWAGCQDETARPLYLQRIGLTNFRNYTDCTLQLDDSSVVLTGRNGSGKTNILEAVSLLSPGRGLRGAPFADLARLSAGGNWAVSAQLVLNGDEIRLGTGQQQAAGNGQGRSVRIDGESAASSGALGDYIQVLWLIPAMDGLFTGPASDRRRFLDRIVSTFDAAHRTRLNQFERAVRQRNKMLELGAPADRMYDAIESQIAELGVAIAAARLETALRLSHLAAQPDRSGTSAFPHALLSLEGLLEEALAGKAAVDVEDDYANVLASNRNRDRAAGRTLLGPHRSDLLVRHGPKDMPAHLCSTGEQKALLIGLILAHAKAVKDARGGLAPLLLLDEIAAHLDMLRRERLVEEIEALGAQAWLTGTDEDVFAPLKGKAQFFTVADGAAVAAHDKETDCGARRMGTA